MIILRRSHATVAAVAATLLLAGCASGGRSTQMIAPVASAQDQVQSGQPGFQAVTVSPSQGGSATNPLWMSNVSADQFDAALKASLQGAGFLAPDGSPGQVRVSARLIELERPLAGLDLTVKSRVHYNVVEVATSKTLMDEPIAASGTAKMGEALIAVERLRLANEAAVRANIQAFITRLRGVLPGAD